jgi:CheY-like chemotaxis protein
MDKLGYILLADDSDNDRELTRRSLSRSLANEIVEVANGAEALDFLRCRGRFISRPQADPIVVLLDINMPKVSGLEVLKQVKSDPQLSHIAVVMLTSSREGPDVEECSRLNANAYVVKPVDFEQFAEAIKIVGKFWAVLNELPYHAAKTAASSA